MLDQTPEFRITGTSGLAADLAESPEMANLAAAGEDARQAHSPGSFGHFSVLRHGRGIQSFVIRRPGIRANADVVASVCEMFAFNPFPGKASMSVLNVVPFHDGVVVRVNVDSVEPLWFKIMVIYSA